MTDWMPEEWKDVPGWDAAYQVSSWGRIRRGERLFCISKRAIGRIVNKETYRDV